MTLYELTGEWLRLLEIAEDPEIDPVALYDTMEGLSGELDDKAENYGKVIRQLQADADAMKAEIDRLELRKKTINNSIDRMKSSLETMMQLTGKRKIDTTLFRFSIQKNPAKVVIDDPGRVTNDFLIPQEPKINTVEIKKMLQEGFCFDWAHLEQGESLRIR